MQLGMIGLGRMGGNIVRRLMRNGHTCVVYDRSADAVGALTKEGATGSTGLADFVGKLTAPKVVWVMLPAGKITHDTIVELSGMLGKGDILIDGGNSKFHDDIAHAELLAPKGITFVDVGTGGIDKTPGREGRDPRVENGYIHAGPAGAGHFAKMVHNGMEYGIMQAYAEGFDILKGASQSHIPENRRYKFNLADLAEVWRRGSVIASWLLDLTAIALAEDETLSEFSGHVEDSGEGRWTIEAAIEEAVPADVLTASLYTRFRSRQEHTCAEKILSAMRKQFGGHTEQMANEAHGSEHH